MHRIINGNNMQTFENVLTCKYKYIVLIWYKIVFSKRLYNFINHDVQ